MTNFSDGYSFLPIIDDKNAYFKKFDHLVAINRSEMNSYTAKRRLNKTPKKDALNKLFTWAKSDLPCGSPIWLAQAKNTLITGGNNGICLIESETGKIVSSLPINNFITDLAISKGKIYASSENDKLICIDTK